MAEGFELAALGTPEEAASKLLQERIAPKGSNKTATLIQATRRYGDISGDNVDRSLLQHGSHGHSLLHYGVHCPECILVSTQYSCLCRQVWIFLRFRCGSEGGDALCRTRKLYTFNAQCPEAQWDEWREVFKMAADSFHVFPRPTALQF